MSSVRPAMERPHDRLLEPGLGQHRLNDLAGLGERPVRLLLVDPQRLPTGVHTEVHDSENLCPQAV